LPGEQGENGDYCEYIIKNPVIGELFIEMGFEPCRYTLCCKEAVQKAPENPEDAEKNIFHSAQFKGRIRELSTGVSDYFNV
jgi:hypothetical protein